MLKKIIVASMLALVSGCGTTQHTVFEGEAKSDAEADYRNAVKTMESGANDEAIKAFNEIKLKYPYATRWTTLSDLRIADAYRNSGDYATAAASYQDFMRTYPAHSEIPYAAYQSANCYYSLMPSDYFFLPDPWQRDRKSTQQAQVALATFIQKFPDDENIPKAKEQYAEVRRRLAHHEIYVAEYYFKQEAYAGSSARLEYLIKTYPDTEVIPSAHILLAHSYIMQKDPVTAKRVLNQLIEKFPDSDSAATAKAWIEAHPDVP